MYDKNFFDWSLRLKSACLTSTSKKFYEKLMKIILEPDSEPYSNLRSIWNTNVNCDLSNAQLNRLKFLAKYKW